MDYEMDFKLNGVVFKVRIADCSAEYLACVVFDYTCEINKNKVRIIDTDFDNRPVLVEFVFEDEKSAELFVTLVKNLNKTEFILKLKKFVKKYFKMLSNEIRYMW